MRNLFKLGLLIAALLVSGTSIAGASSAARAFTNAEASVSRSSSGKVGTVNFNRPGTKGAANDANWQPAAAANDGMNLVKSGVIAAAPEIGATVVTMFIPGGALIKGVAYAASAIGLTAAMKKLLDQPMADNGYVPKEDGSGYSKTSGMYCVYDSVKFCARSPEEAALSEVPKAEYIQTGSATCTGSGRMFRCPYTFYEKQRDGTYKLVTGGEATAWAEVQTITATWQEYQTALQSEIDSGKADLGKIWDAAPDAMPLPSAAEGATLQISTPTAPGFSQQGDSITDPSASLAIPQTSGDVTTTTKTNPDGTQTKEESKTDYSWSDSGFDQIPTLWERKYPDGFVGVLKTHASSDSNSKFVQLLKTLTDGAPNSGTCPSWKISFDLGSKVGNFGNGDISPPCDIWPIIRAIVIITALFVARGLVFGG